MRPKERIPILLELIDWSQLETKYGVVIRHEDWDNQLKEITKYWNDQPDQRFGQMLINLQLVDDQWSLWNMEWHEFLEEQGCEPIDYFIWGVNFDKDRNRLPKTIWKPIKELELNHIEAILNDYENGLLYLHIRYIEAFNKIIAQKKGLSE